MFESSDRVEAFDGVEERLARVLVDWFARVLIDDFIELFVDLWVQRGNELKLGSVFKKVEGS